MNNKLKEKYLSAFIIAFAACVIAFLPIIIMNGGSFFYYGDYNKQQIVFYTRLHDAVRSGTLSSWDFLADLGSDTVSAYSFYLLGSPFFWLSTLFPSSAILITMPLLIALKSGIASVGAYALSRRFCQNRTACLTAGILFGLSAYNSANILFNHFHEFFAGRFAQRAFVRADIRFNDFAADGASPLFHNGSPFVFDIHADNDDVSPFIIIA